MSIEHVTNLEYISQPIPGHAVLRIHLNNLFGPYLLGTSYCDHVTIWWDAQADEYDDSLKIYAVEEMDDEDDIISKVEEWYDCELIKALKYVQDNLI